MNDNLIDVSTFKRRKEGCVNLNSLRKDLNVMEVTEMNDTELSKILIEIFKMVFCLSSEAIDYLDTEFETTLC